MILFVTFLYFLASSCSARPNYDINPQNVITVPPNCPSGWEWVNGQCRELWRAVTAAPSNVITVPPNCPPGQQFINGQCREVWPKTQINESNLREIQADDEELIPQNVITVPPNCRPGQQWINGQCRDIWRNLFQKMIFKSEQVGKYELSEQNNANRNVISVPSQCPVGYRPDALGNCRPILNN